MRVLSVDLGTSNTVAVLSAYGQPPRVVEVDGSATMPSAVFADEDGRLVVGRDAERRARLDPARYEPNPKRRIDEGSLLLGDVVISVTDALAAVLRRVGEETTRQLGGRPPDEVRLTHPAQWGSVRRGVLLGAARAAGLGSNPVLVPEPVAAAAHFASFPGQALRSGQALAVYDLGAGTFDCAVIGTVGAGFVVLAEDGLPDLGGLDVDQALAEHLGRQVSVRDPAGWQRLLRPVTTADRRVQRALREDVKAAKEALSRHQQTEVPLPEPFQDALVTRGELEALIRPSLLRSVEVLTATISAAGLTPELLAGIYLVGGSSRIPLVATLIAEQLRVVPSSLDQPETAVALGAHHVPRESTNVRTTDLASQPAPPQLPQLPQRQPPQPPRLATSPPRFAAAPDARVAPSPVSTERQRRQGTGKVLLAVLAAVVVGAVVAAAFVVFDRGAGANLPAAAECEQPGEADDSGFTRCLRQLAGDVADRNTCSSGRSPVEQFSGISVSCPLDANHEVTYVHSSAPLSAQSILDVFASATEHERIEAEWAGNGLRGRYVATVDNGDGVGDGVGDGALAFTVADRPVWGLLLATDDEGLDPNQLADYFEQNVQPGS